VVAGVALVADHPFQLGFVELGKEGRFRQQMQIAITMQWR
jgi:hypothetical protein